MTLLQEHTLHNEMYTRRKFRDTNASDHLVVAIDTTQSTHGQTDLNIILMNKLLLFSTETYPHKIKHFKVKMC